MRLQQTDPSEATQIRQKPPPSWYAGLGVTLGALAMLLAVVQFWAGPFAPQQPLEQALAERTAAFVDGTLARLRGEPPAEPERRSSWNVDRALSLSISILATLAIITGVIAVTQAGSRSLGLAAVTLGVFAITFQFAGVILAVLLLLFLAGALLSLFGIG